MGRRGANCRASVSDAEPDGVSQKRPTRLMLFQRTFQLFLTAAMLFGTFHAAVTAEESLGNKIKKILAPTPTPSSARKHRQHSAKKPTATPSPTASPRRKKATPTPMPTSKSKKKSASPTPTPEPEESTSTTPSETPVPPNAE